MIKCFTAKRGLAAFYESINFKIPYKMTIFLHLKL